MLRSGILEGSYRLLLDKQSALNLEHTLPSQNYHNCDAWMHMATHFRPLHKYFVLKMNHPLYDFRLISISRFLSLERC